MTWISVPEAVAQMRAGRPLIVTDAADRENEGDLVIAAQHATPAMVNLMVRHACGLVCVAMTRDRLADLGLPQMVERNTAALGTAFTVPVDARVGTTTGISAYDRAATIRALIDPATRPDDLLRPGHVFPLQAAGGGVLERPGHTEAVVDLARLAELVPAGVVCEILAEDGTMARGDVLADFADRHQLSMLAIADLIAWRLANEPGGMLDGEPVGEAAGDGQRALLAGLAAW